MQDQLQAGYQLPLWLVYIRALGTPFAALVFGAIAAWISYRQWKISEYRYRYDLFDRRYKVYEAVQEVFGELMRDGKISSEVSSKFAIAANEAKFLFGDDVDLHLDKLVDALFKKRSLDRKMSRKMGDEEFEKLSEQDDQNWDAIFSMMKETKNVFAKYLKIPK